MLFQTKIILFCVNMKISIVWNVLAALFYTIKLIGTGVDRFQKWHQTLLQHYWKFSANHKLKVRLYVLRQTII